MKPNSLLIELYPGNSNTDNYIRLCNIAKINYKRICVNISSGDRHPDKFRECDINLDLSHIEEINQYIKKYSIGVVLTQWKRSHLESQLEKISQQTVKPDYLVVYQNENHVDITDLKKKYDFIHVHSDHNTKYFGRFAYCFSLPVDICIVMDDDIIPGNNFIKNYAEECVNLNGIIGGNGRFGYLSPYKNKLQQPIDVGVRNITLKTDFVGHTWCFKKEWLKYMFGNIPFTYDTSEDMHFCFTSKLYGDINSYTCKQLTVYDMCDTTYNSLADDQYSAYKTTPRQLRIDVEKYWVEKGYSYVKEQ